MKYSFVLALFWALLTASEFPAFAQTDSVKWNVSSASAVTLCSVDSANNFSVTEGKQFECWRLIVDAHNRSMDEPSAHKEADRLMSIAARSMGRTYVPCSLQSANAANSLAVKNPEQSANLWKLSVATLISANALDIASSYGLKEGNPLLGTRFDGRSLAIKSGLTAGQLVAQYFVLRKHPERRRTAAIVNFAIAGGLGIVSAHNFGIRSGR